MHEVDRSRALTATDVARAAKVSQSTVSLVLNGKWQGRVREETARRVLAAVDELGYRINESARNLRLGSSGTVLMVVPTLVNPVFAVIHAGAARVAAEAGLGVVVFPLSAEDGCDPFSTPRQSLDGVIACSVSAQAVAKLRTGLPLAVLDDTPLPDTPTVTMDTGGGMAKALAHLVDLGHRRIMHLRAERSAWTFARRAEAFDQCVLSHPQLSPSRLVTPFDLVDVRGRAIAALSAADRPTAVICDDDNMAMAVLAAAAELDLTVGEDLSLVGFNDLSTATVLQPPLTTVRLPLGELGAQGMQALIELRGGGTPDSVVLPTELVVRRSTGPAPA
ncbi:LacI family DNA-binding transcriptional regulator [Kitasatospora sp. NPDC004799]|uniref:LacI family DNA-binding transcriptional regulator n=1 Tax=Kitasatospora sp. NPDC004799 TaxID=3154460 RepID=UPI0033B55797